MSVAARRGGSGRVARRRGGRAVLGAVALAAIAAVAWLLLAPGDGHDTKAANDAVPLGAAAVERRDLVDRQDVDGTLGFSDTTKATAPAAGTITRLRDEGDTVTRGRSLMSIDAKATAWVLYGTIPMYRDLGPGVSDGRDVRQLERNLKALGYDPGTVDDRLDVGHDRRGGRLPGRSRPHAERDDRALAGRHQRRPRARRPAQRRGRGSRAGRRAGDRADLDHPGRHREARRRTRRRRAFR